MSTPKPASESSRDATDQPANGEPPASPAASEKKITFTIDRELAAKFKRWAKAEGRLHSKLVEICISDYLKQHRGNGSGYGNGNRNGAQSLERSVRREDRDKRQNENFDTITVSINEALLLDFRIEALRKHKHLYALAEDCLRMFIPPEI